ncbi:MAG: hypothetical protein K2L87_04805 [Clostridiales bacterium]|nr:hypothetical protein [Clostridiales bacterium]
MRTITITSNQLGRYDDVSPFLMERGELELAFVLPKQSGEFYFVPIMNDVAGKAIYIPRGGTVTVEITETGEFKGEVKQYLRGELVEVYHVDALIVKKVDTGFTATPEIVVLREENEALRNELTEFKKQVGGTFAALQERERKKDIAFLSYAYAEYKSDIQLNSKDLDVTEFLWTLGYSAADFTDEEIIEITNKREDL